MVDEITLEILSKVAYENAVGLADVPEDAYFKVDAEHWKNLPPYAKSYWKKIVTVIILAMKDMDVGDLG